MNNPPQPPHTYTSIVSTLLTQSSPETMIPLQTLPTSPRRPRYPHLSSPIADLQLHPVLESLLHVLNLSLASAHFLLRHMESPRRIPEAAFIHGILHRMEGDMDNARAWYRNVRDLESAEVWDVVWGKGERKRGGSGDEGEKGDDLDSNPNPNPSSSEGGGGGEQTLAQKSSKNQDDDENAAFTFLDAIEKFRDSREGDELALRRQSLHEIKAVMRFCEDKFGTTRVEDATKIWVRDEEHGKKGGDMIVGGEGWREF